MAGLLDIFGTGGQSTMGLLGMSPEDIMRSRDDAQAQALYALAGRLFQGGNVGQSIAEGMQAGQKAYKTGVAADLQDRLTNFQLRDMLEERKLKEAARQRAAAVEQLTMGAYQPGGQPTIDGQPWSVIRDDEGNIMPGAGVTRAGFDMSALMPKLMAVGPEGRAQAKALMDIQKSMAGESFKLGQGEVQYQRDPFTGETRQVAEGPKKRETITVGNVVLDKDTMQPIYTAPDSPAASIKEFHDFSKLTQAQQRAYLQLQEGKRPTTTINMPGEGERKAATLATRLNFSVSQINEAIGADPSAEKPNTAAEITRFLSRTDFLPNKINSTQRQIVEGAQLDVLDAALTLGTGAAYTREQLEGYRKSYFPQMSDDPATVKSKQARLNNILKAAEVASGRAIKEVPVPRPPELKYSAPGLPSASAIDAEIERRTRQRGE